MHEVFEISRIIELAVVERIGSSHRPRRLGAIRDMTDRERNAFESRDFSAWIRLSCEFLTALARLTCNTVLCDCRGGPNVHLCEERVFPRNLCGFRSP
ncbi:UNVERIFIED_ORG: DNA-binding GntR family transcriptional regulator [Paraburkholderia sediminicola]|nr:DNA-binding GntR family transcriptional regulator [Paraburkholderia sediminicola]